MKDSSFDRVASIPWAARLLNDPKWTVTRTGSRLPKSSGEDSFFAETLATNRTIRTCLTLRTVEEADDEQPYKEIVTIVEIGDGLNGFPQVIHGGMAATLLDEVCGVLIVSNTERVLERAKASGSTDQLLNADYMTAYLNMTYRRPVPTPGPLLCTAKVDRQDGRKLYVRATIEDGRGTVYTIGEALFIKMKAKL
ncbi:HotDog domain-containing protein [Ampelomyces quisqualis]|uniref:HotDog domain-containing protein n=1 Tax=Ampelomyces quisqualis TaxID=50730 RepID=A0A6A5R2W5_AMPQU|nr:HotDog domain-containing protein [Ampelomyces quisqualis]